MKTQAELHREDRAKYNLVHPVHGTITKARANEIWAKRGSGNSVLHVVSFEEDAIVLHLWKQLNGYTSWMTAFFIFLNQEPK